MSFFIDKIVAVTVLLVPRFGLIGAGVGLLFSAMIQVLGDVWALHQVVRVDLR